METDEVVIGIGNGCKFFGRIGFVHYERSPGGSVACY